MSKKKKFSPSAQLQSLQEREDDEHCRETTSDQHGAKRVLHIVCQHFIRTSPRSKGANGRGKKKGMRWGGCGEDRTESGSHQSDEEFKAERTGNVSRQQMSDDLVRFCRLYEKDRDRLLEAVLRSSLKKIKKGENKITERTTPK